MHTATFSVELTDSNRAEFASLSGDFNPLHTDELYAKSSNFGHCVLHGAFSAGLFSRLAGMHLPGRYCLLHGMSLRFSAPIITPIRVVVEGRIVRDDGQNGEVMATIREEGSGRLLVEGSYQYGRYELADPASKLVKHTRKKLNLGEKKILVTGASGGLGQAVCSLLGEQSLAVSRGVGEDYITVPNLSEIDKQIFDVTLDSIVHCAWPQPSSEGLLDLANPSEQVEYHITDPLKQCLALARLMRSQAEPGAALILVGSSYSSPGRHGWRMPLYSLAKGMMPSLVKILALELAASGHIVVGITLDVIKGGMNRGISPIAQQAHADRSPWGELPEFSDIAKQVAWVLENRSRLISGATFDFTASALP